MNVKRTSQKEPFKEIFFVSNLVCVSRRYPLRSKTSNAARYKVYTRGDFSGFMNSSNLLHLRYLVSKALYWNLIGIRNRLHTSINLGASHIHAGMVIWQFAGYVRQWFYPQTRLIASGKVFRLARKLFTLQNSE